MHNLALVNITSFYYGCHANRPNAPENVSFFRFAFVSLCSKSVLIRQSIEKTQHTFYSPYSVCLSQKMILKNWTISLVENRAWPILWLYFVISGRFENIHIHTQPESNTPKRNCVSSSTSSLRFANRVDYLRKNQTRWFRF